MKPKTVRTYAPATISNLGPGYDVLGIAIPKPGDYVTASRFSGDSLEFSVQAEAQTVPGGKKNVAAHVARLMMEEFNPPFGIHLILEKVMPVGSGLGSSAASSVAAAMAVNALLPEPLDKRDLLPFVLEGERLASGAAHADNVAPSLLGGACLIRSYDPLDVISIPVKNLVTWVVVHPHVSVRTADARRALPKKVPLQSAIKQWGNVGGLVMGLMTGNAKLLGSCVEDVIVEPVRSKFIPGFEAVKRAAILSGALGCSISGSGPSMFAIASTTASANRIASVMVSTFRTIADVKADAYISNINILGARVMWERER